jgi:hypothetical protein
VPLVVTGLSCFESLPAALAPWQNFYVLTGTAAATLTGLMFVAVTFGSSIVTRETSVQARAFLDPPYMHFVQILMTACLLTVPMVGETAVGGLFLAIALMRLGGLYWVFRSFTVIQRRTGDIELSDWVLSIAIPAICHLLLLATSVAFFLRMTCAFVGLAIVVMMLLFTGIHGAWELFVWMAVAVGERRQGNANAQGKETMPGKEST